MLYPKTSSCLHRIYWRAFNKLYFFHSLLISRFWVLRGREISTGEQLSILYAGSELQKNYLIKLAFGNSCEESSLGKKFRWNINHIRKQRGHDYSLMVAEIPQPLRFFQEKKNCFYVPLWVIGEADIPEEDSRVFKNKSLASDLSRIRRNQFDFEVSRDRCYLKNFYYSMYVPYIKGAHGTSAYLEKYEYMENEFSNCELLFIRKAGEHIAGALIRHSRKEGVRLWLIGIKDNNQQYIREGAIGALYYFSFLNAREKGYSTFNLGSSRAFLKDGVLRYKKKWNMRIVDVVKRGFLIRPLSKTIGLKGFFLNNPYIYLDNSELKGAVFIDNSQTLSRVAFEKILKNYNLPGLSEMSLYLFEEKSGKMGKPSHDQLLEGITLCSAERLF